jgi:DHA1 family bicyclomycin/chloramphenicol resistance-like MFS transporter
METSRSAAGGAVEAYDGRHPGSLVWILGALAAFGAMSVDMYLPSLPTIGRDLSATAGRVQLTLSAFFIGFAVGQLVYGPLSDRFGRLPVLIVGLGSYIVTSAFCALSPSIEALIGFRLLHALGGGAGTVVARAIVRDRFPIDQRARVLSLMMLVTGLAPLLAPLVGGYVLKWFGWRAIFWLLTGFGTGCLIAVLVWLSESNPARHRDKASLVTVFAGYGEVFADIRALGCILAGGFAFAGMFAYISGTPFIYIELFGVPPEAYGYLFGLNIVSMMIGTFFNSRLVAQYGAKRLMAVGSILAACAATALLVVAWTAAGGLIGIVIPLFFYIGSLNLIVANAIALATENFPHRAGAVVALFGAAQFGLGALAGAAVGQLHDNTALPMATVIATCSLLSLSSARILARRH